MKLVIAEKPSVARDIAKVIGAEKKENGYLIGNEYCVTWCIGHLIEAAMPEKYDLVYEKWNTDNLPFIPSEFKTLVKEETKNNIMLLNS